MYGNIRWFALCEFSTTCPPELQESDCNVIILIESCNKLHALNDSIFIYPRFVYWHEESSHPPSFPLTLSFAVCFHRSLSQSGLCGPTWCPWLPRTGVCYLVLSSWVNSLYCLAAGCCTKAKAKGWFFSSFFLLSWWVSFYFKVVHPFCLYSSFFYCYSCVLD